MVDLENLYLKLKSKILWLPVSLAIIVALATFTHFYGLFFNPAWYDDEGWTVFLIKSLFTGIPQASSVIYIWLPHAPLSYYLAMPFFVAISDPAVALRTYVAIIAILTAVTVYFLGKAIGGRFLGLISGIIYAVMTPALIYYRIADPDYALGALFATLAITFLARFVTSPKEYNHKWLDERDEILFLICMALAMLSLYYIIIIYPAIFFAFLIYGRRYIKAVYYDLLISVLPVVALFAILYLQWGQSFLDQLYFALFRLGSYGMTNPIQKLVNLLFSYWWFLVGMFGLIFFTVNSKKRIRPLYLLLLLMVIIVPMFTVVSITGSYAVTYLFPVFAIGIAAVFVGCWTYAARKTRWILYIQGGRNMDIFRVMLAFLSLVLLVVTVLLFFMNVGGTVNQTVNGFVNPYPDYLFQNQTEMHVLASWVNNHTTPNDFVVGSPYYIYLFDCKASDYTYVVAFGGKVFYVPPLLPNDPVIKFNGSYQNAKYAIVDPFVTEWFTGTLGNYIYADITANWTVVYTVYSYTVYQNPSLGVK